MGCENMEQEGNAEISVGELAASLVPEVRKKIKEARSKDKRIFGYLCNKVFDEQGIKSEGLLRSELMEQIGAELKDEFNLSPGAYRIEGENSNIRPSDYKTILKGALRHEEIEKMKGNEAYLENQ